MTKKNSSCAASSPKPVIGITLGDPAGIGPEVIAKSLRDLSHENSANFLLVGDKGIFEEYFPLAQKGCEYLDLKIIRKNKIVPGEPGDLTAQAALGYLQKGVELLKEKRIQALVTGPLSKEAISRVSSKPFVGHTEFLAEAFGMNDFEMMFVAGNLRTVVVTRHMALAQVPQAITADKVLRTLRLTAQSLKKLFHIQNPKIAVCGLNPHAGEGGKMGREEIEKIAPAIAQAQAEDINAQGPFPADTIFSKGLRDNYDVIVAMYHDQGIIPVKTLAFNTLVNMTIGLPFVRTSPAHGTAFNIAGTGKADSDSMKAAIQLAVHLARR